MDKLIDRLITTTELNNENVALLYNTSCRKWYELYSQVLWHDSCHFVIILQLLSSTDFSYKLILKPFTLKFVNSVISECLIKLLFPKLWQISCLFYISALQPYTTKTFIQV